MRRFTSTSRSVRRRPGRLKSCSPRSTPKPPAPRRAAPSPSPAAAAPVAIVVQGVVLTTIVVKDHYGGEYGLASHSSGEPPRIVVRFSPKATASDITNFLDVYKAEVVAGPRRGNFYHLRLSTTP